MIRKELINNLYVDTVVREGIYTICEQNSVGENDQVSMGVVEKILNGYKSHYQIKHILSIFLENKVISKETYRKYLIGEEVYKKVEFPESVYNLIESKGVLREGINSWGTEITRVGIPIEVVEQGLSRENIKWLFTKVINIDNPDGIGGYIAAIEGIYYLIYAYDETKNTLLADYAVDRFYGEASPVGLNIGDSDKKKLKIQIVNGLDCIKRTDLFKLDLESLSIIDDLIDCPDLVNGYEDSTGLCYSSSRSGVVFLAL